MKIAVYVPCFNGARHLAVCIASLLTQTRLPDEIIVVDDGSTDHSSAIARMYPVKLVRHETNLGLGATRKTAIKTANADFIASIDADCFAHPNWLKRLADRLERNPDAVGIAGKLVEANYTRLADRWRTHHLQQNHGNTSRDDVNILRGANTLFRCAALREVRDYNPAFRTNGEDVDICLRMRRRRPSIRLMYDAGAVVMHLKEDSIVSILRAQFRYYFYPQVVYRPCDSFANLWRHLRKSGRATWKSFRFDLRHKLFDIAIVSAMALVYVSYKLIEDYLRNRLRRRLGA